MKTLNFISKFVHYDYEVIDLKPYTIRKDTPRLRKLMDGKTHLKIQRAYTKTNFIRKITNTLFWNGWIIFSWNTSNKHICIKNYIDGLYNGAEIVNSRLSFTGYSVKLPSKEKLLKKHLQNNELL